MTTHPVEFDTRYLRQLEKARDRNRRAYRNRVGRRMNFYASGDNDHTPVRCWVIVAEMWSRYVGDVNRYAVSTSDSLIKCLSHPVLSEYRGKPGVTLSLEFWDSHGKDGLQVGEVDELGRLW